MKGLRIAHRAALGAWSFCIAATAGTAAAQTPIHSPDLMLHDGFDGANGPYRDADAARFLAQATFGPTDSDISHLRVVGYQAWLAEQIATPPSLTLSYMNWVGNTLHEQVGQDTRREAWFLGALGGPDPANNAIIHRDQLRQRVAFALSELFVVSEQNALLSQFPKGIGYHYDLLVNEAFGNFRQLLEDVTLSPAMGVYLNMMANQRANSAQNIHPDENYAREINQLFSVGLVMLNTDGTTKLDSSNHPIPTYAQNTIAAFAHVFTGWNWYDCTDFVNCGPDWTASTNFLHPMAAFAAYHDNGTAADDLHGKQLLSYTGAQDGGLLADGKTPAYDLKFALDNIYNHPNVAPFVCKQLIQRLVASNPSPAYVQRVVTVFNGNRASATQLQEVVKAILLDPEARGGQWQSPDTFGKLREPLLALTHFWRAMDARHTCGLDGVNRHFANQPYRYVGYTSAWNTDDSEYGSGVAQAPVNAPSVFNFFKPGYLPPGELTTRNLRGPEFQLQTDSVIANTTNGMGGRAYYYDGNNGCAADDDTGNVTVNHARDLALAGSANGGVADPATHLVDAYNLRFMSGQMSPFMRQAMLSYLNTIDSSWGDNNSDWRLWRI
ncbi:MAG: DUF1800 family protein, partial [Dokdonella sp.]